MARSTGSPIWATDSYARTPATEPPERFTGYAVPTKSPRRMFRKSSPPIDRARGDAPITATVSGKKNGLRDAATAT